MDFTRCYGCMRELSAPGTVCPHCGYDNTNDPNDPKKQPSHVLPCGTVLNGQYMVGRSLGQGGFGITYIGYDLNLEIPVCIKEYYPEGSAMRSATQSRMVYWGTSENAQSMKESRKSFVKEAQKAVKLRDLSHVVTVWGVFYENETAYIVMDYIEGETLKSRLVRTQKTLTEKECVELLTPVMEDLEKAHERGIIHRDIKPDNIMLTSDEKPVLLDMGAAKDLGKSGGSTRSSSTVVSQGFSPLEQYREKGDIGAWTDVYAMSATIYYCVTGKVPDAAIDRIIDDNVSFSAFTPAFAAVLRKGLIIRLENRIQTMDELLGELTAALSGQNPADKARRRREEEEQRRREEEARQAETREQEERQETAELEKNYQRGKTLLAQGGASSLREAESIFAALGRYRDAAMQAAECRRRLDQLTAEARIHKAPVTEQEQSTYTGATVGTGTKKSPIPLIAAVLVVASIGFFAPIGGTGGSDVRVTATPKPTATATSTSKPTAAPATTIKHTATPAPTATSNLSIRDKINNAQEVSMEDFQYLTAVSYYNDQDYEQALVWFQKAADAGHTEAMCSLGKLYAKGQGVTQDYVKMMEWLQKAADSGSAEAMCYIGGLYEEDGHGVTQDYKKAMEWYQKAAVNGYAAAMQNIGELYENGHGVTQNYDKAMEWYQKAADTGYKYSMYYIASMYENGNGVTQDQAKADEWRQKAKDAGYTG